MSQSSSSSSSGSYSSGSPSSNVTTTSNDGKNDRLQALLKKHLTSDRDKASRVEAYHQREFIGRLDDIVQTWMVKAIFALKDFAESQLTVAVEEAMIVTLKADLNRQCPLPSSPEAIEQLEQLYRNAKVGNKGGPSGDGKQNLLLPLPKFNRDAYYLPSGPVPENVTFSRLHSQLRPLYTEAQDQLWRLSVAIHLLVPMIADSHNTGVIVQRKVLASIRSMKGYIAELLISQGWLSYSKQRCAHLKAIYHLPQSEDARLAYINFERSYFRFMRNSVRCLSKELLLLQHLIMQHLDLLKAPRQDYTGMNVTVKCNPACKR